MKVKNVLSKSLVCGLCIFSIATVATAVQAKDTALRSTIITQPMPVEPTQKTEPSIKDRTNVILAEFNKPKSNIGENGVIVGNIYIPKDSTITLELIDPLSSKQNKKGDVFRLRTTENTLVNNVIIIPKGTECTGTVLKAKGNGAWGSAGHLEIDIDHIKTLNGIDVPLNGYVKDQGNRDNGAAAVGILVSLVGGLFMKGENIYFNPGQTFRVSVQKDTDLMTTPEHLQDAMKLNTAPSGNSITVAVSTTK